MSLFSEAEEPKRGFGSRNRGRLLIVTLSWTIWLVSMLILFQDSYFFQSRTLPSSNDSQPTIQTTLYEQSAHNIALGSDKSTILYRFEIAATALPLLQYASLSPSQVVSIVAGSTSSSGMLTQNSTGSLEKTWVFVSTFVTSHHPLFIIALVFHLITTIFFVIHMVTWSCKSGCHRRLKDSQNGNVLASLGLDDGRNVTYHKDKLDFEDDMATWLLMDREEGETHLPKPKAPWYRFLCCDRVQDEPEKRLFSDFWTQRDSEWETRKSSDSSFGCFGRLLRWCSCGSYGALTSSEEGSEEETVYEVRNEDGILIRVPVPPNRLKEARARITHIKGSVDSNNHGPIEINADDSSQETQENFSTQNRSTRLPPATSLFPNLKSSSVSLHSSSESGSTQSKSLPTNKTKLMLWPRSSLPDYHSISSNSINKIPLHVTNDDSSTRSSASLEESTLAGGESNKGGFYDNHGSLDESSKLLSSMDWDEDSNEVVRQKSYETLSPDLGHIVASSGVTAAYYDETENGSCEIGPRCSICTLCDGQNQFSLKIWSCCARLRLMEAHDVVQMSGIVSCTLTVVMTLAFHGMVRQMRDSLSIVATFVLLFSLFSLILALLWHIYWTLPRRRRYNDPENQVDEDYLEKGPLPSHDPLCKALPMPIQGKSDSYTNEEGISGETSETTATTPDSTSPSQTRKQSSPKTLSNILPNFRFAHILYKPHMEQWKEEMPQFDQSEDPIHISPSHHLPPNPTFGYYHPIVPVSYPYQ